MFSHAVLISLLAAVTHAAQFVVTVGADDQLRYNPTNLTGVVLGDEIVFEFFAKNHTVTQSSFMDPCSPLSGGIDSGFMPVFPNATMNTTFTVRFTALHPIWFSCRQPGPPAHCQQGMVFSVNAPSTGKTAEAFLEEALALGAASSTSSEASVFTTPTPVIETVTQTVTLSNSVYTTTYASWEGSSPNPTPAAAPAVHTVQVGSGSQNAYSPTNISANINDTILFVFNQKNHTVTQSTFGNPCTQAPGGFDSGFQPFNPNTSMTHPTFSIKINDSSPTWVYCGQTGHCSQDGMVFAVNAPSSGPASYEEFVRLALHSNGTATASGSSGSPSTTGSGSSPSSTSGAGRAVVSVGLGLGITGFVVAALL